MKANPIFRIIVGKIPYINPMVIHLLLSIVINAGILWATVYLLPSYIGVEGGIAGLLACAVILGIINIVVRPILKMFLKILAIPFLFIGGLIVYVLLNMSILYLLGVILQDIAVQGVAIHFYEGGWSYFFAALVFGLANTVASFLPFD